MTHISESSHDKIFFKLKIILIFLIVYKGLEKFINYKSINFQYILLILSRYNVLEIKFKSKASLTWFKAGGPTGPGPD